MDVKNHLKNIVGEFKFATESFTHSSSTVAQRLKTGFSDTSAGFLATASILASTRPSLLEHPKGLALVALGSVALPCVARLAMKVENTPSFKNLERGSRAVAYRILYGPNGLN